MADVIAGRYELGELIGTGGNGQVFAARDRVLDRVVAVKLVDAEAVRHRDPAGRERFLEEARSSAGFSHPNAVAVFDAGEADGSLYLVMELVEGPTLADRLESGPLEPVVAAKIAADVLAALDAAHRAGIVHRDIKPANVLLDAAGSAKVADFGIAKRLDSVAAGLTNPGQFFGTPKYLAPEQVDGRPVSAATDVYATGVVLFEMLAGHPPFDEGQPMATAIAQRDAAVPDLRAIRPEVPETLVTIVETALRKEPEERFESAEAMRAALTAPLWPAPPAATPPPAALPLTAAEPTVALPPRVVAPTAVLGSPQAADEPPVAAAPAMVHLGGEELRPRKRAGRTLAIALAVVAVVALVLALATRDDSADSLDPTATTLVPGETVPPTVAPTETVVAADPGVTAVLVTVPVITPLPILPSDVPMLIGFLAADPAVAGPAGEELVNELEKVADKRGKKQRDEAEKLVDKIGQWVEDEMLDESIADLSIQLLERLAGAGG